MGTNSAGLVDVPIFTPFISLYTTTLLLVQRSHCIILTYHNSQVLPFFPTPLYPAAKDSVELASPGLDTRDMHSTYNHTSIQASIACLRNVQRFFAEILLVILCLYFRSPIELDHLP